MAIKGKELKLYFSVEDYQPYSKNEKYHKIDSWFSKISKEMKLTDVISMIANQGRNIVFDGIGIYTYQWDGVKADKKIVSLPNIIQNANGLYFAEEFDASTMYGDAKECANGNKVNVISFDEEEQKQNDVQKVLDELIKDCRAIQNHIYELCNKL